MRKKSKHGYVMMLDVLGFKEYVSKQTNHDFFSIWKALKKDVTRSKEILEKGDPKYEDIWHLDVLCLSDTLVLCLSCIQANKKLTEASLGHFIVIIESFFMHSFKQGVFFRGAISFGDFICDTKNNIAMGNAIDEAYEWHNSTDWIGIILTPSAKFALDKVKMHLPLGCLLEKNLSSRFVEYDVPFKSPICFKTFAFVWFNIPDDIISKGLILSNILDVFSGLTYSKSIISKYINTLAFVEKQLCLDIMEYKTENTRIINGMKALANHDNS